MQWDKYYKEILRKKNIEIIFVDDIPLENMTQLYNELLDDDPRVRVFYHMKKMGLFRTRLDGFLYSAGQYILHFDAELE